MKAEDTDLSWLYTFNKDELIELLNEIIVEVNTTYSCKECVSNIKTTLHEWEKSALAINNSDK